MQPPALSTLLEISCLQEKVRSNDILKKCHATSNKISQNGTLKITGLFCVQSISFSSADGSYTHRSNEDGSHLERLDLITYLIKQLVYVSE